MLKEKGHKIDNDLVIRAETRFHLKNTPADIVNSSTKLRHFFVNSVEYVKKKLPIADPFMKHATFADVYLRKENDLLICRIYSYKISQNFLMFCQTKRKLD